jgi:hypothetical protein
MAPDSRFLEFHLHRASEMGEEGPGRDERDKGGTTMRVQVQTMHTESMQELCNDASCDQFEASGQGGGIDFRV